MIHCNLSVLLAERQLKISRVAAETGISRTTLTALAYNNSQGIQMNTLNTLCIYLNITPDQLLSFSPVDVVVEAVDGELNALKVRFSIRDYFGTKSCVLYGRAEVTVERKQLKSLDVDLTKGSDSFDGYAALFTALRRLSPAFISDIETVLFKRMADTILGEYCQVGTRIETVYRVIWPTAQKEKPSPED